MNQTTSFKDLIKDGFINTDMLNTLSVSGILFSLFLTFIVTLFIHYVYKKTYHGVLYTRSFNDSLILISLVTTMVIMTISTNLILSLGMVGALSIVRFRTAVKDAMDIVFLFWAIGVGIANGAGIFAISIVGSIFLGGVMLILQKTRTQNKDPYLLIVKYSKDVDRSVWEIINSIKKYTIKSKNIHSDMIEATIEMRIDNEQTAIVNDLSDSDGVIDAVLIKYNADYVS